MVLQAHEELVELSNGCICCTMRGDLLREVTRLAKGGAFDYLLIESTGVSEPMQVQRPLCCAPLFALTTIDTDQMHLPLMCLQQAYCCCSFIRFILDIVQAIGESFEEVS